MFTWDLFQSPETKRSLFRDDSGRWLVTEDGTERWPVILGIPDFIDREAPDAFGEMIRKGGWPRKHWSNRQKEFQENLIPPFAARIMTEEGTILEIASGPGGGFMPWIVLHNNRARILAFDRCRMLLEDWKLLLEESGTGDNVTFAAFDARRMPLRDACVDVVSNRFSISNISEGRAAIEEIWRVLKPGGRVYSQDIVFKAADWGRVPTDFRKQVEQEFPDITRSIASLFSRAGLAVISSEWDAEYLQDPEQSGIAQHAAELGVPLHVSENRVIAVR